MKKIVQSRGVSPMMLFALSILVAQGVYALGTQAPAQDKGSAPAPCDGSQLSLRNYGETIDMGPMRSIEFIITNISASPCTLTGYPSFEFLNRAGRAIRADNRVILPGNVIADPKTITIEPGKTARFFVYYNARYDEEREKPCPFYRTSRVIAPGTKRLLVQRFRRYAIEVCSDLKVSHVVGSSEYE